MKFVMEADISQKTTLTEYQKPTIIFLPTSPTNQNLPLAKTFDFCVFRPIWIKFGMGAYHGPKTTSNEFETAMTIF